MMDARAQARVDEMVDLYNSGLTFQEVADKVGATYGYVYNHIRDDDRLIVREPSRRGNGGALTGRVPIEALDKANAAPLPTYGTPVTKYRQVHESTVKVAEKPVESVLETKSVTRSLKGKVCEYVLDSASSKVIMCNSSGDAMYVEFGQVQQLARELSEIERRVFEMRVEMQDFTKAEGGDAE